MYGTPLAHISAPHDRYGFVNEDQVRVAAGLSLGLALVSFVLIAFFASYTVPLIALSVLWADFVGRVFWGPDYSVAMWAAARLARTTTWVGSVQKRFAWSIGLALSTIALGCVLITSGVLASVGVGADMYTFTQALPHFPGLAVALTPPLVICMLCIIFMALEAFAGFCVGCYIYAFLVKKKLMRAIPHQTCASGVCHDAGLAL